MKKFRLGLVATTLVTATFSNAFADEVDARALLEKMSAEIAGLDSFVVHGDAYSDARLEAGQIIEHSSQVTLRLRREPASIRVTNRSADSSNEVYFDDGMLSVYNSESAAYAQIDIPKNVNSMLDFAVDEVGIDAPMLDLISADIAGDLLQDADEVSYLETSLIRGETYHHIAFRTPETDVQIWIATEGRPLPGKLTISSKWEGGSPRFVSFLKWEADPVLADELFRFDAPDDAIKVDFLPDLQQ